MTAPSPRLASVIVHGSGPIERARRCIAALARHTRMSWEMVVVTGDVEGSGAYLRGLRDAAAFGLQVVAGREGHDLPDARNRAMAAARGDYLVLLDEGVVVSDAWLDQLIALAESDPAIGMAGPMLNDAAPPQLAGGASYRDLDAMHQFASRWRSEHRGRWLTAAKLCGSCVLIKRSALVAVPGPWSDVDELATRMRRAGYELAVAQDLFVHHSAIPTEAGLRSETATAEPGSEVIPSVGLAAPGSTRASNGPESLPPGFLVPRLAPGSSREMVGQALAILGAFAGTASQKAALWERLAAQIVEHGRRNGSTWGMERFRGGDDSIIYMGRASEFLVFDASGKIFRGQGAGCLAGSREGVLVPHYPAMKPAR